MTLAEGDAEEAGPDYESEEGVQKGREEGHVQGNRGRHMDDRTTRQMIASEAYAMDIEPVSSQEIASSGLSDGSAVESEVTTPEKQPSKLSLSNKRNPSKRGTTSQEATPSTTQRKTKTAVRSKPSMPSSEDDSSDELDMAGDINLSTDRRCKMEPVEPKPTTTAKAPAPVEGSDDDNPFIKLGVSASVHTSSPPPTKPLQPNAPHTKATATAKDGSPNKTVPRKRRPMQPKSESKDTATPPLDENTAGGKKRAFWRTRR